MSDNQTTVVGIRLTDAEIKALDILSSQYDQTRSKIARYFFEAGKRDYVNRARKTKDESNSVPSLLQFLELSEASTQSGGKC
tara:strand:- start:6672 stop:6917 length:246 start_codon:yes stop_codon:yes gene_type:complete